MGEEEEEKRWERGRKERDWTELQYLEHLGAHALGCPSRGLTSLHCWTLRAPRSDPRKGRPVGQGRPLGLHVSQQPPRRKSRCCLILYQARPSPTIW